jgi:hypothetical protein
MSFPNKDSVNFPHRNGTLNFYDDKTHLTPPDLEKILNRMKKNGIKIKFCRKAYKPFVLWLLGMIVEPISKKKNKVLRGTWQFYGFETVIWGIKE